MTASGQKVAIVGAGRVGSTLAYRLAAGRLCSEVVLVDGDQRRAWAEAADLQHALSAEDNAVRVREGSYYDCADAAVCVVTAGVRFAPNTPRLEQMDRAATAMGRIVPSVMGAGFDGVFLVVSRPVDLMTWLVQQLSGLPDSRVLGTGTVLDTARLRCYLASALQVDVQSVSALVMGEHGEDRVIPWSQVTVDGTPLEVLLRQSPDRLPGFDRDAAINTVADIAYNLASVKGETSFGIASAAAGIVASILRDEGRVMTVSAMLSGQYGQEDVYAGVPAEIGAGGVRRVVEYPLTAEELAQFGRAVRDLREYMTDIS